jgi:Ca2+-transporting ATPase
LTDKKYYNQTITDLEQELQTSKQGLSEAEAAKRLAADGPNELQAKQQRSWIMKFFDQFKDLMIIVLIVAALAAGFVAGEWTDAAIILVVVILNAALGLFQEARSEQAIASLQEMATPQARVRRDGAIIEVESPDIVKGDVVLLEAGDVVPADLRLIRAHNLKIEESALTGESLPIDKTNEVLQQNQVALGDRINMAFSGTNVTYGRGEGIVVRTGMQTRVGQIAKMLNNTDETMTPLKANLNHLGKILTFLVLGVCVLVFAVGVWFNPQNQPMDKLLLNMFLTAVSLAVAAIPEGLPAIVTIILALGTQRLAKQKAIVRKLPAVETLGATDIIASDKTGTLTQNKMTVEKVFYNGQLYDQSADFDEDNPAMLAMILANDTKIQAGGSLLGDPTETALIQFAFDQNIEVQDLLRRDKRLQEVAFDSDRKLMSTVNMYKNKQYFVAVKGAPDMLLKRATRVAINGKVEPMSTEQKQDILLANQDMAKQALRVLGLAYKIIDQPYDDPTTDNVEQDLVFAGLVGMIDPERPEAKAAIAEAKQAGIRTIMITGDHPTTAQAIAERLGIIDQGDEDSVITGAELDELSDRYLEKHIGDYSVYARVSPEHKVRIVKAWQDKGKIVAMTGDGVNDAPSLKQADIGVGMGITGTEVSKSASDMILADDNFATIVRAVREGRQVFANIQKALLYLMSCNVGEVLTVFLMTIFGWDILAPVQLLWINLVTDTLPAIALGVEPVQKSIMHHRPRGRQSNFFSGGVAGSIIYQGILESVLVLGTYAIGLATSPHASRLLQHGDALTMAFLSLGLIQLFHAFNSKSVHESIWQVGWFKNHWFNVAIVISPLVMASVELPFLTNLFDVTELNLLQWLIVLASGVLLVVVVELVKLCQRRLKTNN